MSRTEAVVGAGTAAVAGVLVWVAVGDYLAGLSVAGGAVWFLLAVEAVTRNV